MAKIGLNAITEHFRGRVGDLVFRRVYGRLHARLRSGPRLGPPTEAQQERQTAFAKAVAYAKAALANPALGPVYLRVSRAKQQNVFATAIGDYFNPPVVQDIDLSGYRGRTGDPITIRATDDVAVVGVAVLLRAADGTVLEAGEAVSTYNQWVYTATTTPPATRPVAVEVTARDHPGNTGTGSATYP